ncbi:hypothetical protein L211DRAFT_781868 [Terfezia boudieri ATCC MYA-4762]|uniref:F-box domain-containing protein n=1 Tax=Terfezia boudieri ATCC MYA-4762 TaxID=1051890 RepID=A0A3N4M970_9PEZI|nr:hypothetical protein L211DRAFT_781868 [Terfezia boudieri ATCC MYA-4762]
MSKRRGSPIEPEQNETRILPSTRQKRVRLPCYFQSLSDELVLKILSFLTTSELTRCQQVCRRLQRIAGDDQVWKSAFYDCFVRPQAPRLSGSGRGVNQAPLPAYSSRSSIWLDDMSLVKAQNTHWKQLYKLRHNWTRGSCCITEIGISAAHSEPPLSVQMRRGIIFTVDSVTGLQAWRAGGEQGFIARISLKPTSQEGRPIDLRAPTALAVDDREDTKSKDTINVAIGYESGNFSVYQLSIRSSTFASMYTQSVETGPKITTMAFSGSHLMIMNSQQNLLLYYFPSSGEQSQDTLQIGTPVIITSFRSHTIWPPVSLSLRRSTYGMLACIVYTVPTFSLGWSVAIQELQLNLDGTSVQRSRIASAVPQNLHPNPTFEVISPTEISYPVAGGSNPETVSYIPLSQPTSLSYAHPYLLTAHNDNTLTIYLVKSTNESLEIAPGQQLFGHTSAVSGAHIGSRGRAVSISTRGSELRVWELEGSIPGNRRGGESVKVYPSPLHPSLTTSSHLNLADPLSLSLPQANWRDGAALDRWLGFDDEKVIVHREKETGSQVLMVYDFS